MDTTYLTCAETAKLIRAALKEAFPAIAFRVKSKTYSGGASIDIDWTDGPTSEQVNAVAKRYEGADFDGSIDLKCSNYHWLMPDGSVVFARTPGTEGSRGVYPAQNNPQPHPDAKLIQFGADFVFTSRKYSCDLIERVITKMRDYYNVQNAPTVEDYIQGRAWRTSPIIGGDHCNRGDWQSLITRECSQTAA